MARFRLSVKTGRRKRTKRTKRARKARVSRKTIRREARQAMRRQVETKERSVADLGRTLKSSASATFDASNIIPLGFQAGAIELAQGVGQGQRVGNKVELVRLLFKGTIVPYPYNATTNNKLVPMQIKLFIFYDREDPNSIPAPQANLNFLDFNNAVQGLHNDLVDLWAPVNEDRYKVVEAMGYRLGYSSNGMQNAGVNGWANYANNDFKLNCNFRFDLTKHMIKKQVFQDNSINSTVRQLYAMFVLCCADGSPLPADQNTCGVQFQITAAYKDA